MTKIIKTRLALSASFIIILLVAGIGFFNVSKAFQSSNSAPKVVVEGDYIEAQEVQPIQESLGGAFSPDIVSQYICVNNDCTFSLTRDFIDSTTTIAWIPNPFLMTTSSAGDVIVQHIVEGATGYTGATSTVEMARLYITGVATSTFTVACGPSNTTSSAPVYSLISSDSIVTSTLGVVENNISSSYGARIGGGSVAKVMMGPTYPFFVCKVTTSASNALYQQAFTDVGNTFDGKLEIRVSRHRF